MKQFSLIIKNLSLNKDFDVKNKCDLVYLDPPITVDIQIMNMQEDITLLKDLLRIGKG